MKSFLYCLVLLVAALVTLATAYPAQPERDDPATVEAVRLVPVTNVESGPEAELVTDPDGIRQKRHVGFGGVGIGVGVGLVGGGFGGFGGGYPGFGYGGYPGYGYGGFGPGYGYGGYRRYGYRYGGYGYGGGYGGGYGYPHYF